MEGVIPITQDLPVILGHEASGVVDAVGEGVTEFAVGDAVAGAISPYDAPGVSRDGAYAEYILLTAAVTVKLPEGTDFAQAAAATDAGVTSYNGVIADGGVKSGDRVGIVGLGGLGMTGARIAVANGAEVYGVEPRQDLWERAKEQGVTEVFADVSELKGLDLDVIADFAGFGTTTTGAIQAVKERGRVVLVGLGAPDVPLKSIDLVSRAIDLQGSTVPGDPKQLAAVLKLIGDDQLRVKAETIGFDEIPAGLKRLAEGKVNGRLVAVFD
jgi:propanol-preferring alcohol dehydrogenase